jgi:glycosyltransferase involved in cell wall biosynthesis
LKRNIATGKRENGWLSEKGAFFHMNKRPLRILYVTSCWPHDRAYGGQLRALHIGRALKQLGQVTLVVVGAHEVDSQVRSKTAAEFELGRDIKTHTTPTRGLAARLGSFFDRDFTNIHGVVADPADEAWFVEAQKQFDLVWFCKLRTANYFKNARWQRSVVDVDDLPSTMEKSRCENSASAGVRMKARLRMIELRRQEKHLEGRFDVLAVCSEADRKNLGPGVSAHVIPNGFTRPAGVPVRRPAQPPRIGFMGLYSYEPNLEGVRWFINQCWQRIKKEVPDVRLRLVGEATDGPLKPDDSSIDGLGWLESPDTEVASWSSMIVPIWMGAGTRVKIADALSRKCPVVSTRLGAFGYDVQSGRELILADDPGEFAAACVSLIKDPKGATDLAERGFSRFLEKWTWEAIAPRISETVEHCLRVNSSLR